MMVDSPLRAVDTNVLLRYLLGDVPEQSRRARQLIDSHEPLGLTAVALAEVAWVLSGPRSRLNRFQAAEWSLRLLNLENIQPIGFDIDEMRVALRTCADGNAGLGDALIAGCALSGGIVEIYSFDRTIGRTGLTAVVPGD